MENNGEEVTFLDTMVREGLLEFSEALTSELMPKGCRRAWDKPPRQKDHYSKCSRKHEGDVIWFVSIYLIVCCCEVLVT